MPGRSNTQYSYILDEQPPAWHDNETDGCPSSDYATRDYCRLIFSEIQDNTQFQKTRFELMGLDNELMGH